MPMILRLLPLFLLLPTLAHAASTAVKGAVIWPASQYMSGGMVNDVFLIDASAEKVATVFSAPVSCTVDRVLFRTGAVTTSDTIRASLQNVSLTDGNPTGTVNGTAGTISTLSANTFYEVTGLSSAITRGTYYAIVLDFNAFSAGSLEIAGNSQPGAMQGVPYVAHFTASWAKINNTLPAMGLRCATGAYHYIGAPASPLPATVTLQSTTTPDEVGNEFTPDHDMVIGGFYIWCECDGDADIVLYQGSADAAGSNTAITTPIRLDSNVRAQTGTGWYQVFLDAPETLAAGTTYKLTIEALGASNVIVREMAVSVSAQLAQLPGGTAMYKTSRADDSTFTDVTTTQIYGFGLILAELDDGAGGACSFPGQYLMGEGEPPVAQCGLAKRGGR